MNEVTIDEAYDIIEEQNVKLKKLEDKLNVCQRALKKKSVVLEELKMLCRKQEQRHGLTAILRAADILRIIERPVRNDEIK